MKAIIALTPVLVLFAGCFTPPGSPTVGDPAPAFAVWDTEGKEVKLAQMEGKPVVLFFMSVTCGTCSIEQKNELVPLERELSDKVSFVTMTIGPGEGDNHMRQFKERTGADWPHCIDSDSVGQRMGITQPSYVVALDSEHRVVLRTLDPPAEKIRSALGL